MNDRLIALEDFTVWHTTKKQKKEMAKIEDKYELFIYIVSAYNCYVITHSKAAYSMITNPEKLCISREEMLQFSKIMQDFVIEELRIDDIESDT